MKTFPTYRCIKKVQAFKIASIGNIGENKQAIYQDAQSFIEVDDAWVIKHNPQLGGYIVLYKDGYISYSPAKAFEEGYVPDEMTMPFGQGEIDDAN